MKISSKRKNAKIIAFIMAITTLTSNSFLPSSHAGNPNVKKQEIASSRSNKMGTKGFITTGGIVVLSALGIYGYKNRGKI